ncbi:hypothetical protein [Gloeothece verrucosa]|uniref:Uncharacterized protein n=1 Tax=Gloeothece verrucosa (strain PCC 7822) TaxID=497965 RepID=E0UM93_GLOV7|nr:hypothetical protein [Gloeothece verrucosa]ADN18073.1 hypothetical protein Cyan7822_6273 [Gloeothece verrucosa PCC 7822]
MINLKYRFPLAILLWGSLCAASASVKVNDPSCGEMANFHFACFGPIELSGGGQYGGFERSWQAGEPIGEILTLGDLENFGVGKFRLSDMITKGGGNFNSISIGQFPLIASQKLKDLVPLLGLNNMPASQFPGLESMPKDMTLSQALEQNLLLGDSPLTSLNIGGKPLSAIPGLYNLSLSSLPGWNNQKLAQVPFFESIPLSKMPIPLITNNTGIFRIDALRNQEGPQQRTISGSDLQGWNVACSGNCDYVELDDPENIGSSVSLPPEGVRWISGKKQNVEGGSGCLRWANGGKEPTGRLPFGSGFKVALWDISPASGKVTSKYFVRACNICGCTPYFIGPFPGPVYKENEDIFAGFEGLSSIEAGISSIQPLKSPSTQQKQVFNSGNTGSAAIASANSRTDTDLNNNSMSSSSIQQVAPSIQPQNNSIALSWSVQRFANALGSVDYAAVSPYLCRDEVCGYRIGMYQMWNQSRMAQVPPQLTQSEVTQGQIQKYFPKNFQEKAFQAYLERLDTATAAEIDPFTKAPFSGEREVQRIAQMYYGGEGAKIDADIPILGQGSLLQHSRNFLELYRRRA